MEIVNPRNLYSGNAVVVDTSPSVKFATQLMAQKQAKEEALNKYFADQLSKANPQGLRQQELQPFFAAKDDLQNYYLAHAQDINHPNARNLEPYQEYQRKWQTLNNVLYSSKDANARTKEIDKVRSNPNAMDRLASSSLKDFDLHANPTYTVKNGQVVPNEYDPVNNPTGYKPYDMNFHFNPKEYKANEMENLYETYGKGMTPANIQVSSEPVTNPDGTKSKYSLLQTTKLTYKPEQLRQTGINAKDAYLKDGSLQFTFENNNPFDPNNPEHTANFDALNAIHNKYLGGDIKDNSDLYAASVIARKAQEAKVSTKTIKNEDAEKQFALNKMYAQHKLTQDNIKLSAGLRNDKESNDAATSADAVLHNLHDIISAGTPSQTVDNPFGIGKNIIEISDPNLLKTFSTIVKDGTTPVPADHIYFNKATNQGVLSYNMADGSTKQIPISGADMAKAKAKETYTGANAGKVIDVIDKVVTKNGGLVNALKMYDPNNKQQQTEKPIEKPVENSKTIKIGKYELPKIK